MRAAGVHIFAGSFSLGIQRAGFDIQCVYENLGLGLKTARENFSFPIIYPKEKWHSYLPKGINLVYANPPCSAFSVMGLNRGVDDPINSCMFECADIAIALNPDIYIMESVLGLWDNGQEIITRLDKIFRDFQRVYLFSDSVLHGSPQIRPRFHYIASRFDFKISEFYPYDVPTLQHAIWDLQFIQEGVANHEPRQLTGQIASIADALPSGFTASEIWRRFPEFSDDFYGQPFGPTRRASWRSPGPTITGGPTIIHPSLDRFLTIREEARIFGYPDSYEFRGNRADQYAQIGKAVTCFMGEFLGRSARLTLQSEEEPQEKEKIINLFEYTQYAKRLRQLDWFGPQGKTKLVEENFG